MLVATDVLSEGQNLQDCCDRRQLRPALGHHPADPARRPRRPHRPAGRDDPLLLLPAGRRRGAHHPPARPRAPAPHARTPRWSARTRRSSRMTGTTRRIVDLYNEKAGILDGDDDGEVDLASYAYQIWKNAIDGRSQPAADHPGAAAGRLLRPRAHRRTRMRQPGVLVYMRTAEGNDALAWVDRDGQQRHRVAVRHPAGGRLCARHAGPAARTKRTTTWCRRGAGADR